MAKKKSGQVKSIPDIYSTVTNRDTARLKQCVVEDVHGGLYRFDNPGANHILKEAVRKCWANQDAFDAENKQTILAYHEQCFKAEPPKDQDLTTTSVWTWYRLCELAVDRTTQVTRTAEGRKSSILSSTYVMGELAEGNGDLKTPQAIACAKIFRETLAKVQLAAVTAAEASKVPLPKDYMPKLTEAELKQAITDRASELHTRQDPWRIFQYYRSGLIAAKILKRIS